RCPGTRGPLPWSPLPHRCPSTASATRSCTEFNVYQWLLTSRGELAFTATTVSCFSARCLKKLGGEAQRMMQPSSSETPERDTYADPIQSILITSFDTFADAGLDCRMPDSQPLGEYGPNRRYQVRAASPRSATCGFSRWPSFR